LLPGREPNAVVHITGERSVAHSSSAKKRIRQNIKRRSRNRWRKMQVKEAVREFNDALRTGDRAKAAEQLKVVYKRLDTVAAKGTIHKNAAARKKSRLARKLNQAGE
jgi:small subunit ribosomal protein S20